MQVIWLLSRQPAERTVLLVRALPWGGVAREKLLKARCESASGRAEQPAGWPRANQT